MRAEPSLDIAAEVERLFTEHGSRLYDGSRAESVTALAHALQCAQLAEWAHAGPALVAASLVHDVGHFLDVPVSDDLDDAHEHRAMHLLAMHFGPAVTEPVRLHVAAKRFLVATDTRYAATLSAASVHSLQLQGGPMEAREAERFEALPYARDAVVLRRWDDLAKEPGRKTPPLDYYLPLLRDLALPHIAVPTDQDTRCPRT